MRREIPAKLDMLFSSTLNTCEKMLKLFGGCLCRWGGREVSLRNFKATPPSPSLREKCQVKTQWVGHGYPRLWEKVCVDARGLCKRMCIGLAGGLY